MRDNIDFKTFLLINHDKVMIVVKDIKENQFIYKEETKIQNISSRFHYHVEEFLQNHIFEIEKKIDKFVNNIYLIFDHKEFFSLSLSVKKSNYGDLIDMEKVNYLLNEAKDQCKKTLNQRKIIHMYVNNYRVDEKEYKDLPKNIKCEYFSVDLTIISLSENCINSMVKILSKFQISLDQILNYKYVNDFKKSLNLDNIFEAAEEILEGKKNNEVIFSNKSSKNKGFFEKFFFFFN